MKNRTTQFTLVGRLLAITVLTALCGLLWLSAEPGEPSGQAAVSYPFPGRAENLLPKHYWYMNHAHAAGIQSKGYDIKAVRFAEDENAWTQRKDRRQRRRVRRGSEEHGLERLRAARSRHRRRRSRSAAGATRRKTPRPVRVIRADCPTLRRSAAGGNHIWVDHGNGEYALYAHFKPGTIPANVCPINQEFISDPDDPELPSGNRPQITKGPDHRQSRQLRRFQQSASAPPYAELASERRQFRQRRRAAFPQRLGQEHNDTGGRPRGLGAFARRSDHHFPDRDSARLLAGLC